MIRELGNVKLFELCETIPKVQCSHRLLYWNHGIGYCTCGQCLIDSESRRKFHKLRLEALSFPDYVIKKGPTDGARHGKTEVQREYHLAWNAWKRCCKRVDSQELFKGSHDDRFLRDQVYCESQERAHATSTRFSIYSLSQNRLHCESGEEIAEPISPQQYRRWHVLKLMIIFKRSLHLF